MSALTKFGDSSSYNLRDQGVYMYKQTSRRAGEQTSRQTDRTDSHIYIDGLITFTRDRCERERI